MPLNREFVGRSARSSEPFEVTRGDIRRFAVAMGDTNPTYLDPKAAAELGHPDVIAPPTFLITIGASGGAGFLADPALGLRYEMVVHGEQRFDLHRPVRAGDLLESTTRIADIRDAGRNELMTLVSEVTSRGEAIATVTNTIVSRGTAAPKEA
jgi:acyl dehydratase